ncbi:putative mis12 domain-containing protein [Golovinomyces cichoracearum]|uniref:Putative mis12 domain-containing protein n=1 Tax=Golovinomyces cichoracearum TaxID=62708 RepID=A0A420IY75_9PEZI|nr:putative mis12 domain-containing protein [Golovinomyces cichoracearum]
MSASCGPATAHVTLLTEHLTYRPISLIDDIVNSINILAFKATEAVEKSLLAADPIDLGFKVPPQNTLAGQEAAREIAEKAKNEIENGVHQLETLLEAKIDKNFDRLEIYALRNILNVPANVQDWVRLSHYEGLHFTSDAEEPNTESIRTLRMRLRETQKLHACLKAELATNQATITALNDLTMIKKSNEERSNDVYPIFGFLHNKGELTGDVTRPATTSASFVRSQLPALEGISTDLKPRLERLATIQDSGQISKDTGSESQRVRFEFIERETRRHLEVVQGLELGEQGEVRDGEWQGDGRKIPKEEVVFLERALQIDNSSREKEVPV